jgi:beta-glucosidase
MRTVPAIALGGVAALVFAACSASGTTTTRRPSEATFPEGFMFGSATAAFQIEKGITASDWSHWVTAGKIKSGEKPDDGPDALAHIDEDVALLKSTNQNAYRFSMEWSRIYPTRAAFDADTPDQGAIDAYAKLLAALKAAGIKPMVTLMHFTLPDYLSDVTRPKEPQGWERPETVDLFEKWCGRIAKRFGADVDWWATLNEPVLVAIGGYVQGSTPPGLTLEVERALTAVRAEARAHARCYDAIKANDTIDADGDGKPSMVGPVLHQRTFEPFDKDDAQDQSATDRARYFNNFWFLNTTTSGDWDDDFDNDLTGPNDKKGDPALKGRADYIGINYYSTTLVSASRGIVLPKLNAAVYFDRLQTDRPKSEFGWDIYPSGIATVLEEVQPYRLPVVITENGIADSTDQNRARFLAEHLYEVGLAIGRNIDVRGYFYWSLYDNFEWSSGFCPRFGLFAIDRQTKARSPRRSVELYKTIASTRKVTTAQIEAAGTYVTPPAFCQ